MRDFFFVGKEPLKKAGPFAFASIGRASCLGMEPSYSTAAPLRPLVCGLLMSPRRKGQPVASPTFGLRPPDVAATRRPAGRPYELRFVRFFFLSLVGLRRVSRQIGVCACGSTLSTTSRPLWKLPSRVAFQRSPDRSALPVVWQPECYGGACRGSPQGPRPRRNNPRSITSIFSGSCEGRVAFPFWSLRIGLPRGYAAFYSAFGVFCGLAASGVFCGLVASGFASSSLGVGFDLAA